MCQAIAQGGRRCPIHRRETILIINRIKEETDLTDRQINQVFKELRREGRGTHSGGLLYWGAYLDAMENRFRNDPDALEEIQLATDEGYIPDTPTLYAWRRFQDRANERHTKLYNTLEEIGNTKGWSVEETQAKFKEIYDNVPLRGETPEEFTPRNVRLTRQAGLPYDRPTVVALERLRNSPVERQQRITRGELASPSTAIAEAGYDPEGGRLELVLNYNPDRVYAYRNVPEHVWQELNYSEAPGRYYSSNIRGNSHYLYESSEESDLDAYRVRCEDCGQFVSAVDNDHTCPEREAEEETLQSQPEAETSTVDEGDEEIPTEEGDEEGATPPSEGQATNAEEDEESTTPTEATPTPSSEEEAASVTPEPTPTPEVEEVINIEAINNQLSPTALVEPEVYTEDQAVTDAEVESINGVNYQVGAIHTDSVRMMLWRHSNVSEGLREELEGMSMNDSVKVEVLYPVDDPDQPNISRVSQIFFQEDGYISTSGDPQRWDRTLPPSNRYFTRLVAKVKHWEDDGFEQPGDNDLDRGERIVAFRDRAAEARTAEEAVYQQIVENAEVAELERVRTRTRHEYAVDSRVQTKFSVAWAPVRQMRNAFNEGKIVSSDVEWSFARPRRSRFGGSRAPVNMATDDYGYVYNDYEDGTVTGRLSVKKNDDGTMEVVHSKRSLRCNCYDYRMKYYCSHVNFVYNHAATYVQQTYLGTDRVEADSFEVEGGKSRPVVTRRPARRDTVSTPLGELPRRFYDDPNISIVEDEEGVARVRLGLGNNRRRGVNPAPLTPFADDNAPVSARDALQGSTDAEVLEYATLASARFVGWENNRIPSVTRLRQALRYGEVQIPLELAMAAPNIVASHDSGLFSNPRVQEATLVLEEGPGGEEERLDQYAISVSVNDAIERYRQGQVRGHVNLGTDEDGKIVVRSRDLQCDCEQYRRHYSCVHTRALERADFNLWLDPANRNGNGRGSGLNSALLHRIRETESMGAEAFDQEVRNRRRMFNEAVLGDTSNNSGNGEISEQLVESVVERVENRARAMRTHYEQVREAERMREQRRIEEENAVANYELHRERMRNKWETQDPAYETNPEKFYSHFKSALNKRKGAKDPIEFRTENVTDGICADEPGARAFGVELEFDIKGGLDREEALRKIGEELAEAGLTQNAEQVGYGSNGRTGYMNWSFEHDSTVDAELVSPILRDTPEDWEQLRTAVEIIKRNGGEASTRAGSHVNISSGSYGSSMAKHTELVRYASAHEDTLYRMASNPSRGVHRGTYWCSPNVVNSATAESDFEASDTNVRIHELGGRANVNLLNSNRDQRTTSRVEFRAWDSTLDPAVIQQQIAISAAMVERAERVVDERGRSTPYSKRNRLGSMKVKKAAEPTNEVLATRKERQGAEQVWEECSDSAEFISSLFRRDEDRAQATALFAITNWQE